ncbi:hypothetical protein M2M59_16035 [Rummeliibacillus sp. G93]|uniref:hypothetical protein n=1 Tax=Rummeliibacillus TaxID=648802 RepID=UPI001169BED5|nr:MULTISPECIES: hypothetical protein [Rummeliibacillus]MBB5171210.1 hypothetical protein [Rummeliibacillus stabekisii]UQW97394.1 hypothetical protein M2M59_16035 [Rummeliibacillus sp. G93]GEL06085.1 hypothetical protein RST01_27120 [Rummeliibacillus stabekisii]
MFGLKDLLSLVISAFIILPVVLLIRESGYLIVSWLFGVINPRVTIGTGPRIFKIGMIDIRKYYHLYSWFSYDGIKRKSNFAYVCIYAGPIIANLTVAFLINFSVAHGWGEEYKTFLDRFVFYAIYYVMFDIIPMITTNSKPNNGMIIYEMLRYGKRVDFNNEAFLPSTSEVEKEYQEYIEQLEERKKERIEK